MNRPNFFIVGAPRCGTTALYTYLSEHPNIYLSDIKELHYFASDFPDLHKIVFRSQDDYFKLFSAAQDVHTAVGDISPLYIYSNVALENIKNFDPNAKIILILRNPVEFVQSVHQLNLGLLREDEPDLAKAWDLQDERKQGRSIPKSCREVKLVLYGELGLFGRHVKKVFEIFSREQVLVVLLEDFVREPRTVYESILAFLHVPSDNRGEFPPVNAGFEVRSRLLAKFIHPPQFVYRTFMKVISFFGVRFMNFINLVYGKVERLNTRRSPRRAIEPALRTRLEEYFREDVQLLSGLIGRDLSEWTHKNG